MKKISGKQKLIGAMAIILIATILAIIITANIVINNKVGSEGYAAMNGTERGEMVRNSVGLEFFAHFSTEDFEGHGIYMYADVYDVAGNVSTSYLAYMSADGKEFTYTPQ